jgi:hypothetical protein
MEGVNRTERENSIRSHTLRNRQGDTSGKFRRPASQKARKTPNRNVIITIATIHKSWQSHSIEKLCVSYTKKITENKN